MEDFIVPMMRKCPEHLDGLGRYIESLLEKDAVVKDNGLVKGVKKMKVVIGKELGGAWVRGIINHGRIHKCQIFNKKFLTTGIINYHNGIIIPLANAGVALFPVEIGEVIIDVADNDESEHLSGKRIYALCFGEFSYERFLFYESHLLILLYRRHGHYSFAW